MIYTLHSEGLPDAWRLSQQGLSDDLLLIAQYRQTLAEKDEKLPSGHRLHRPTYVRQCRTFLAKALRRYRLRVRQITETEEAMMAAKIKFTQSPFSWEKDDD